MTTRTSTRTTSRTRVASLLREPALPLLLATSVAMVVREYLPDIVLFLGASVLVVVDAARWDDGHTRTAQPAPARVAVRSLALALVPLAGLMALLPRTSGRLDLAFALLGLVALGWCWSPGRARRRATHAAARVDEGRPPPRWAAWPALGLAVALVELWSFVHQTSPRVDSPAHPTLSTVTEPALASAPARAVALWLWLLAGVWLLRRIRAWTS